MIVQMEVENTVTKEQWTERFDPEKTRCLCKGRRAGVLKVPGQSAQYYASEIVRFFNESLRGYENRRALISAKEIK